jgi:integrase
MARRPKGRANGEGSAYKYDGVWWAQITLPNGRVRRRRARTQEEARAKLRELQAAQQKGLRAASQQPTVSAWCQIWLDTYTRSLKPNIREDYRGVVRRYIDSDPIGKVRLHALTPAQVQDWVDRLQARERPLSAQTVRNAHARLHTALKVAIKYRYRGDNPADETDLPSVRGRPIEPLALAGAVAILKLASGQRWALLYRLAINLGLRQGELLGLTWDRLDVTRSELRISQQLRRVPNGQGGKEFTLQPVKTKAGERILSLDADLLAELRALRKTQAEERLVSGKRWRDPFTKQGGLIFTTETGSPIHGSNLVQHFKELLRAAELPERTRFHDLRHTAATLMLDAGVPLVTVSKILGHSSPAVTANVYAHALDTSKASAIAGLSAQLRSHA